MGRRRAGESRAGRAYPSRPASWAGVVGAVEASGAGMGGVGT